MSGRNPFFAYIASEKALQFKMVTDNKNNFTFPLSIPAYGELKHANNCLQIAVYKHKKRTFLGDCSDKVATKFYFHKNGALGTAQYCLNVTAKGRLFVDECTDKSNVWHRFAGALVDTKTGKCLENNVGLTVEMALCRFGAPTQIWSFSVELQQL
jgi:Ricin-type beta-trefoil lectin domain